MAVMLSELPPVEAPLEPPASPSTLADWAYTVAVRELCEFTAKRRDLDRRFTPAATALEGLAGQTTVAKRRGHDYETEIALETTVGLTSEFDRMSRPRAGLSKLPRSRCHDLTTSSHGALNNGKLSSWIQQLVAEAVSSLSLADSPGTNRGQLECYASQL